MEILNTFHTLVREVLFSFTNIPLASDTGLENDFFYCFSVTLIHTICLSGMNASGKAFSAMQYDISVTG